MLNIALFRRLAVVIPMLSFGTVAADEIAPFQHYLLLTMPTLRPSISLHSYISMDLVTQNENMTVLYYINENILHIGKFIHRVSEYLDLEDVTNDRLDEQTYASENLLPSERVDNDFYATGVIRCGKDMAATGNVVFDSNVLVTAAHLLVDRNDCVKIAEPASCRFFPKNGSVEFSDRGTPIPRNYTRLQKMSVGIPVEPKFVRMGFKCPQPALTSQDWLVLRLKHPIPHLIPYRVLSTKFPEWDHRAVTSVEAQSTDFPGAENDFPKSASNCHQKDGEEFSSGAFLLYTNCAVGSGSSGGAILERYSISAPPTILAIIADFDTSYDAQSFYQERDQHRAVRKAYDTGKWKSTVIPIISDFRDAITEASQYHQ